ncbi:hypothetical protein IFM89_005296 [Coptis chinensis]|uniref:C2H2-type domain-containing protein n=1 Tax=Coptis chinensis TaxID=261450 RepID=A0A835IUS6_9MAGN|nr:hypothetical protein IFM89_005296 [Coptis chinensis]
MDKCIQPNGSMTENNLVTSIKKEAESLEAIKLMESKVAQIGYGAGCDFLRSSFQKEISKGGACALCQVCTTSEFNLQCHLQGKKHESKELELLAKKNAAKNKTASASYSKQVYVPKVTPRQGAPASVANDKYVNKLSGLQLNLMESKVAQIGYREVGATKNIATAVAEVAGGCCELPGVSFQKEAQFVLQCHLQGEKHKGKEIAKNKTVTKWQIRQRT